MAAKDKHAWPDDSELVRAVASCPDNIRAAAHLGVKPNTLDSRLSARHLRDQVNAERAKQKVKVNTAALSVVSEEPSEFEQLVHAQIKRKKRISVEGIADELDVSPKRVRDALDRLRTGGYRIPTEGVGGEVELLKVPPARENLHKLDPKLLDGDVLRVGVVSDTHLGSNEEALPELHLAYDHFEREGISTVWHAGDFVSGVGIFPTQGSEIKKHTFEDQVDYLVDNYPHRPGIRTLGISGNHDIEGQFGRIGANPVIAAANRRDDIEFLGDYSAWVELPNGAWVHLLHGKGGMSYAYSYKAQKLVDGYPSGRKPALLIVGHWHVKGNICARNVEVLWPGCFEWRSKFLERLGLHPKVGFYVLTLTVGEDGSLVRFLPEWFSFYEGRIITGSLAA